jgi:hypothetical protein
MQTALPRRDYDRSLNSEIERLLYQNEVVRADGCGLAADLDNARFNWSPQPGRWSVAQCLEHLNVTHRAWLPLLEAAADKGRREGVIHNGPYTYGFLSRLFLRVLEPPVKLKVKAPKPFRPSPELGREAVVAEFDTMHQRLDKLIASSNGLDLSRIRVRSAFSGRIRYSLGMSYWLILAHDRRHIWQARNLLQMQEFPKPAAESTG